MEHPPLRSRRRSLVVDGLPVAALAVTLAAACGRWHWLPDLANHFRWYYLAWALAWLPLAAFCRSGRLAWLCLGAVIALNGWAMLPYWLPAPAVTAPAGAVPLAIVSLNVLTSNRDTAAVVGYLRRRAPDIAVVLEVDDAWARALRELDDVFPHRLVHPRTDNFGIALLSRHPLEDARVVDFGGVDVPSIVARVDRDAGGLTVVATHPVPPLGADNARDRDAALAALADSVAGSPAPCIVAGDFNATPWCAAFRDLVNRSGLRDTALGRGVQPTWNARSWVPRIPIDHVLAPPGTVVLRRAVGPDVGSDHFPVEAELVLPSP